MGGIPQVIEMLGVAAAIFGAVLLDAFLVSKLFDTRTARKRVMIGAIVIYAFGFIAYFGYIAFVLSGDLN